MAQPQNPYWSNEERQEREDRIENVMALICTIALFLTAYMALCIF